MSTATDRSEPGALRFADVVEGVRAALAAYTQALDDGRTEEVVATFCPDGVIDLPGMGVHEGHDALRAAYGQWTPRRPQRHLVLNTLVTEWDDQRATAVSDVVFLLKRSAGWSVELVGRYTDTLHRTEDGWRFHHRVATFLD
jgi:ketosteroid isomerase-like protein